MAFWTALHPRTFERSAVGWLHRQMAPLHRFTGGAVVPSANYSASHTGAVDGYIVLDNPAPLYLTVYGPKPLSASFTGTIHGKAHVTGTHTVRGGGQEVAVLPSGEWTMNVSTALGVDWSLTLHDSAGTQVGNAWTQAAQDAVVHDYTGVAVEMYSCTDIPYLIATVSSTGTWSFVGSDPGTKRFRLLKGTTELSVWTGDSGLIRSYLLEPGHEAYGTSFESRSYTYDQSLAILAFLTDGDLATATRAGLALTVIQHTSGAFPFSSPSYQTSGQDPYFRTGAVAWCAYALIRLHRAMPDGSQRETIRVAYEATLAYMTTLFSPVTGLVTGGSGKYTNDVFDPAYQITWQSTEHNVDAWFAFAEAGYANHADQIKRGLLHFSWDRSLGKFWQGVNAAGTPDYAGALDVHSWGSIMLVQAGEKSKATSALSRVDPLYHTTFNGVQGYRPYTPEEGYPNAASTLWLEGSFGVVLARMRNGADADTLRTNLFTLQEPDGSFRYAAIRDEVYEISTSKSVASTAWAVMVTTGEYVWTAVAAATYFSVDGIMVPVLIRSDKEAVDRGGGEQVRAYSGVARSTQRWIKRTWTGTTIPLSPNLADRVRQHFLKIGSVEVGGLMVRVAVRCYVRHTESNAPFIDPETGVYYPDGKVFNFTLIEK